MRTLVFTLSIVAAFSIAAAPIPTRTPLGSFAIDPAKTVTHVETSRVDFLPGQQMPEHMHPVPVICFVTRGTFLASIGAAQEQRVTVGEATLEPAGQVVHYFRNASTTEAAQLVCALLAGKDDTTLSVMLQPGQ